jgi:hypothetical protein
MGGAFGNCAGIGLAIPKPVGLVDMQPVALLQQVIKIGIFGSCKTDRA